MYTVIGAFSDLDEMGVFLILVVRLFLIDLVAVEKLATLTFKKNDPLLEGDRIRSLRSPKSPPKDLSKAQGLKGHLYQQIILESSSP